MNNLTDQERAAFVAYANAAGIVFTLIFYFTASFLAGPYYNPSLTIPHVLVGLCLFLVTAFFLSLNNNGPVRTAVLKMASKSPKNGGASDAESYGWVMPAGIAMDFVVMGILVGLTGGTIESLFSPYILTMIVIGQFLTPRMSMKIILGLGGATVYAAVLSPGWLLSLLHVPGGTFSGPPFGIVGIRWIYYSVFAVSVGIATVVSILSTQEGGAQSPSPVALEAETRG